MCTCAKVPIAPDVVAEVIARGTPGMSGAALANLVNEAALFAAPASKRLVDMEDFERAKDKILMGAERRSMVMPEESAATPRIHESGHAILGLPVAQIRSGAQSHDHPAWTRAGRDDSVAGAGSLRV